MFAGSIANVFSDPRADFHADLAVGRQVAGFGFPAPGLRWLSAFAPHAAFAVGRPGAPAASKAGSGASDLPCLIAGPGAVRSILLCQLRQIGDVLLLTPSIELLARRFPGARIHVLTEKKCAPMLEGNPYIHKLWPLDKKALANPFKEMAYYRAIGAEALDLAVDFQQLPRCRAAIFWSKARLRLSYTPPWYLRWLYTHWHSPGPAYAAAQKAGVLAPLGIVWNGEKPRLYLSDDEKKQADGLLAGLNLDAGPFISLDVTHRHPTRRWPARHYAALLDKLADALPDWSFFLPYGPGEEGYLRDLIRNCRHASRAAVPKDLLSLRQMAACIGRAALHIGNCSSPRHMATALDVPTITIHGATSNGWTFPSAEHLSLMARQYMKIPCQPCNKNVCPNDFVCLERLEPDLVFASVMDQLRLLGLIPA